MINMKLKLKQNLPHLLVTEEGWMESLRRRTLPVLGPPWMLTSPQRSRSRYQPPLQRAAVPVKPKGSLFLVQMQIVLQKKQKRCLLILSSKLYLFDFAFRICYFLENRTIPVKWDVTIKYYSQGVLLFFMEVTKYLTWPMYFFCFSRRLHPKKQKNPKRKKNPSFRRSLGRNILWRVNLATALYNFFVLNFHALPWKNISL